MTCDAQPPLVCPLILPDPTPDRALIPPNLPEIRKILTHTTPCNHWAYDTTVNNIPRMVTKGVESVDGYAKMPPVEMTTGTRRALL